MSKYLFMFVLPTMWITHNRLRRSEEKFIVAPYRKGASFTAPLSRADTVRV